ncbi:hypothetical protein ACFY7C_04680 [Streptomyces sp. NPDC012769]|uniref:hypothetical protein n=1 Tax=Streptomyces sp. NPDC012769 TaxID=3364848 RepID=UPI003690046C
MRIGLWILAAVYAVLPGARALDVYLEGPPADMTPFQVASMTLFGPLVAGVLLRAAHEPLIGEAWRCTPRLLRVLLPLGHAALFAFLAFTALAVRESVFGPGFDLVDSPRNWWTGTSYPVRELWLLMLAMAAPVLVWSPIVHYEGPQLLLRAYLGLAAGKAIRSGDMETLRLVTAPLRGPRRLPSVTAYNEAVVASLDSLALLNRLEATEEPEALDALLASARQAVVGIQALPGRSSRQFLLMLRDTLGDALWQRHLDTLSSAALHEAIRIRREVLAAPRWTKGVDIRPYLLQLSEALGARFDLTGDEQDLREAVALAERAARARPLGRKPSVEALRIVGMQHIRGVGRGSAARRHGRPPWRPCARESRWRPRPVGAPVATSSPPHSSKCPRSSGRRCGPRRWPRRWTWPGTWPRPRCRAAGPTANAACSWAWPC